MYLYLPKPNLEDTTIWRPSTKGKLTVKSVYRIIQQKTTLNSSPQLDFKWIWNQKCPNKIRYFLWLCQHERRPNKSYLHSLGIGANSLCSLCNTHETCRHVFMECPNVRNHWKDLKVIYKMNQIINSQGVNWLYALRKLDCSINNKLKWKVAFPFFMWNIWLVTNQKKIINFHNHL